MFPIHLDLGFRLFPFYEGFYFITVILLGIFLSRSRVKKNAIDIDKFDTFTIFVIMGAIIGGRLSNYIFWNTDTLIRDPLSIFFVWRGGISITGGITGGILGGWLYARKNNLPFWDIYAMVSPFVLLSQGLGRIGCFLNGDAHGIATDLPWGVRFQRYGVNFPSFKKNTTLDSFGWSYSYKMGLVTKDSTRSAPLHPTQLYETLLDLLLMGLIIFLYKIIKKKGYSPKIIFFTHIGGYSLYRCLLEFIRADRTGLSPLGMSYMQITLLAIFLTSLVFNIVLLVKSGPQTIKAK